MPGLDDLTADDLPTLHKLRDMHRQWLTEEPPADFGLSQVVLYRAQQRYMAEFCGGIIWALTGALP